MALRFLLFQVHAAHDQNFLAILEIFTKLISRVERIGKQDLAVHICLFHPGYEFSGKEAGTRKAQLPLSDQVEDFRAHGRRKTYLS